MSTLGEIENGLLAPDGPFAVVEEEVLGERMQVFRDRKRSLRELLSGSGQHGDADCLVYEGRRISFAEHLARVSSLAAALRERFDVGPGDRVAILAANNPEWLLTWWATVSLGAVAVGLNGWWSGPEIAYGVEDSEPKLLVGDRKRLERLDGRRIDVPVIEMESDFEDLLQGAGARSLPDAPLQEDDAACILYTSGTTGRPKGVVCTHRALLAFVQLGAFHGARLFLWNARNRAAELPPPLPLAMLINTPLFHVSGLCAGALTCLANGMKLVMTAGRYDPARVMHLIETERITNWGLMGTMAHRLLHHPELGRHDLSSMRVVGSGGAPLSPELQEALNRVFPNARLSMGIGYGLTESTGLGTIIGGEELARHRRSVGRPLPTFQVEIRDEEGKALPEGVDGEIHLRGPMIMRGYWRRPEATAEVLRAGRWLRTGDIGRLEEGRLTIDTRARDLILRGGENIYPAEIEQCLESHPGVAEAAVVGVDHAELGQEVMAVVVPQPGHRPSPEELGAWVGERLAAFKVPSRWELRAADLPRNATGKVLKDVLRGAAESRFVEE